MRSAWQDPSCEKMLWDHFVASNKPVTAYVHFPTALTDSRERGEAHHAASSAASASSRSLPHVSSSPALHTSTATSAGGPLSSPGAEAAAGGGAPPPPHIAVRVRSNSGHPLGYADRLGSLSGGGGGGGRNSGSVGGGGGGSSGADRGGYFRSQSTGSLGSCGRVGPGHHGDCEAGLETVKETPTSDEQLPLLGLEIESSGGGSGGGGGGTDGRLGDGEGRGSEFAAWPAAPGIPPAVAAVAGTTATTSAAVPLSSCLSSQILSPTTHTHVHLTRSGFGCNHMCAFTRDAPA